MLEPEGQPVVGHEASLVVVEEVAVAEVDAAEGLDEAQEVAKMEKMERIGLQSPD